MDLKILSKGHFKNYTNSVPLNTKMELGQESRKFHLPTKWNWTNFISSKIIRSVDIVGSTTFLCTT